MNTPNPARTRGLVTAAVAIARRTAPTLGPGGRLAWVAALVEAGEAVPGYVVEAVKMAELVHRPGEGSDLPEDAVVAWMALQTLTYLHRGEVRDAARMAQLLPRHVAAAQAAAQGRRLTEADEERVRAEALALSRRPAGAAN